MPLFWGKFEKERLHRGTKSEKPISLNFKEFIPIDYCREI
jgi:hypothetical protein